jgi:hypothetical protein
MITSSTLPPYVSRTTFKISSEVKQVSIAKMDVKLNSSLLEKNATASSEYDVQEFKDSANLHVETQNDYQKTSYRGGLEFCHEHLFDITI